MSEKRKVEIVLLDGTIFVRYLERSKGQRYSAAQFSLDTHNYADVRRWVLNNPNLELVELYSLETIEAYSLTCLLHTLKKDYNVHNPQMECKRIYFKYNGIEMAVVLNPN